MPTLQDLMAMNRFLSSQAAQRRAEERQTAQFVAQQKQRAFSNAAFIFQQLEGAMENAQTDAERDLIYDRVDQLRAGWPRDIQLLVDASFQRGRLGQNARRAHMWSKSNPRPAQSADPERDPHTYAVQELQGRRWDVFHNNLQTGLEAPLPSRATVAIGDKSYTAVYNTNQQTFSVVPTEAQQYEALSKQTGVPVHTLMHQQSYPVSDTNFKAQGYRYRVIEERDIPTGKLTTRVSKQWVGDGQPKEMPPKLANVMLNINRNAKIGFEDDDGDIYHYTEEIRELLEDEQPDAAVEYVERTWDGYTAIVGYNDKVKPPSGSFTKNDYWFLPIRGQRVIVVRPTDSGDDPRYAIYDSDTDKLFNPITGEELLESLTQLQGEILPWDDHSSLSPRQPNQQAARQLFSTEENNQNWMPEVGM